MELVENTFESFVAGYFGKRLAYDALVGKGK
jgi:hypothetical protein